MDHPADPLPTASQDDFEDFATVFASDLEEMVFRHHAAARDRRRCG